MKLSFRWYGEDDKVTLDNIRQIPGLEGGIVTAIYDIKPGNIWPLERIKSLVNSVNEKNMPLEVIESLPVHEDIKMGLDTRDKYIENYKQSLINLSKAGVKVVTYNMMPVWDWLRTTLDNKLNDGSLALSYDHKKYTELANRAKNFDNFKNFWKETLKKWRLPGWDNSFSDDELIDILEKYKNIDEEKLWNNVEYFIKKIMPTADSVGIKMAIHNDDPPWSIFGVPRIMTTKKNLKRFLDIYDSKNHGLALCTASIGSDAKNDPVDILKSFVDRVHFIHMRNIKHTGIGNDKSFEEVSHYYKDGSIDMLSISKELVDSNYDGYIRPDHGRMIWGETGRRGYGLYDRALGVAYINGMIDGIKKQKKLIKDFREE